MSWPLLITTFSGSLVGMVDVGVAGTIGSSSQAAVGVAEQVLFLLMIFLLSIGVGTTAIVSRSFGEGNLEETTYATAQSLVLSIGIGIVLTLIAIFCAHQFLPLFTRAPEVVQQGTNYLSIYSLYLVPFSLICISNAAFRGIGDAKTPLLVVGTEVIVNIAGDYATVLGNWPVPGLGIKGIAYSAVVGSIVGCLVACWRIAHSPLRSSFKKMLPVSQAAVKRVLNIGVPSAFQKLGWAASVFVLFFILAKLPDPTAALASWSIGMRVEALLYMPLMAFSLAIGSIVGQNLGAKQVDRAFRAGWQITSIGVVMMLILATALFIFAPQLASLMSHDPATIQHTTSYLQINAICEPFLAVNMILSGALQGAGDTRLPMWISLISNWLIRLPLAWYLAITMQWGPSGAWWAMTISIVFAALAIAVRFQTGGWAKIKV